ncbi:hypothetical protein SUGI_0012000 [Cryptomeria japonica]|nr:hypothetical protein SUGI_0012000 [Cryptomeria japonica]
MFTVPTTEDFIEGEPLVGLVEFPTTPIMVELMLGGIDGVLHLHPKDSSLAAVKDSNVVLVAIDPIEVVLEVEFTWVLPQSGMVQDGRWVNDLWVRIFLARNGVLYCC